MVLVAIPLFGTTDNFKHFAFSYQRDFLFKIVCRGSDSMALLVLEAQVWGHELGWPAPMERAMRGGMCLKSQSQDKRISRVHWPDNSSKIIRLAVQLREFKKRWRSDWERDTT